MTTYVVDKEGKFIPATQRPDGTWRKARRVKNGYVPQEEVPLYESKGKQFAQRKPILPPGLFAVIPSEKSNKSKKDPAAPIICKHQQQAIPGVLKLPANIDTTINTNTTSYTALTTMVTTSHSTTTVAATATATATTTRMKTTAGSNSSNGGQALKHSTSFQINHPIHVRDHCEDDLSSKLKGQLQLNDKMHAENKKKIKKLRKKLREIEQIEEKIKNGTIKSLEKDQMNKVKRKEEIQKELKMLEAEQQRIENEMDREKKVETVNIKIDQDKVLAKESI